ncbi:hypothetical protein AVEN_59979-1 [Araneus ventricosus]|uniref:Uncharacterized protein n=1 Tax=Araneus ventricosus TaxID=182803 RepID=A0A4Y2T9K8_ARAVE|nr:hypothetical protein AVEN_59979-1 [Araneus ventricosus]
MSKSEANYSKHLQIQTAIQYVFRIKRNWVSLFILETNQRLFGILASGAVIRHNSSRHADLLLRHLRPCSGFLGSISGGTKELCGLDLQWRSGLGPGAFRLQAELHYSAARISNYK